MTTTEQRREAIDLLKAVRTLWLELSEAEYDCNGGQDFDKALALLEAEVEPMISQDDFLTWLRSDAIPKAFQDGCNRAADMIERLEKALAIARE